MGVSPDGQFACVCLNLVLLIGRYFCKSIIFVWVVTIQGSVLGPQGQGASCQWLRHSRLHVQWCGSEHTGTFTTYGEALKSAPWPWWVAVARRGRLYHRRGGIQSAMISSHRVLTTQSADCMRPPSDRGGLVHTLQVPKQPRV